MKIGNVVVYVLIAIGVLALILVLIYTYGFKKTQTIRHINTFSNWLAFSIYAKRWQKQFQASALVEVVLLGSNLKVDFLHYCCCLFTSKQIYLIAFPLEATATRIVYEHNCFYGVNKKQQKYCLDTLTQHFLRKQKHFLSFCHQFNLKREDVSLIIPCKNNLFQQQHFQTPWSVVFVAYKQLDHYLINHNAKQSLPLAYNHIELASFLAKHNHAKKRLIPFLRKWNT